MPVPTDVFADAASAPPVRFKADQIEMSHGAGGKATRRLVEGLIAPLLHNPTLAQLEDAAILDLGGTQVALTADSFVVKPLRFPGGSIGELAVNGTVNDLAMAGARPQALLATLIIEAGLETTVLQAELEAMAAAARVAGVTVVGGDTKVVEHGKADGVYITTAGFGVVDPRLALSAGSVRPGDRVLLSGPIGDNGITILLARGELDLEADLTSDTRSVWPFVEALAATTGAGLRWLRDPTRGGVASALNELARETGLGVVLDETALPLRGPVRGACEILGLDPLHIANEGQFLGIVAAEQAEAALAAVQAVPGGHEAALIGTVQESPPRTVLTQASYGGRRVVDMLIGDPLPRIC
ncbi:MAG: hydrogenase expression/formation protein HypE [Bacteroidota bacterium]